MIKIKTESNCADNYRLGYMNKNLTGKEIDEIVISQADDENAWEEPIKVQRKNAFPIVFYKSNEIISEKGILGGTPVFRGTRVPVSALFENLSAGLTIDEFLENFPTVSRKQALEILESFKRSVSLT